MTGASGTAGSTGPDRWAAALLLGCVFVVAVCGLVYELVAGTLSSYLLGDSVTQFSLVIGLFLSAMGAGSYLSRFVRRRLAHRLVAVEILVGLVGGLTPLVGFAAFTFTELYVPVLAGLVIAVGVLVGLEIPLVIRLLKEVRSLRVTVSNVLALDYAGALVAAALFPFALLPHLGLIQAGLAAGCANVLVAALLVRALRETIGRGRRSLSLLAGGSLLVLAGAAAGSGRLVDFLEDRLYEDEVILALDTPHQRMVVTRWRDDVRLYLDGHLQFSSVDEYRYHEALAHPAMSLAERRESVLILGGGDGLLAREVLRYGDVARVDLVDLDAEVTRRFRENPIFARLNGASLADPRVRVHNEDAMRFLERAERFYDVVLMDLPDPSEPALAKLYSRAFFRLAVRRLAAGGMLASQATSPFRSRRAFWCVVQTLEAAGAVRADGAPGEPIFVRPYHTVVPTFGTWGFVLAARRRPPVEEIRLTVPTRYLTPALLPGLFAFPADMDRVETPVNRLDDAILCRLYRADYHQYLE